VESSWKKVALGYLRKILAALASAKNSTYVSIEARMRLEAQGGESSIKANPPRGGDAKLWALNRP
jgi:hypothetical protein